MRVIRNVVCALSITIGGANYAQASGIPTVDIAAVMQNMMEYIGQLNEYIETADRYVNQFTNMEEQLKSVTGVANVVALAKKAQELQSQYERMTNNFERLKSMAEDPLSLLEDDIDFKRLFDKLQVYDNCANLSGVEKERCTYDFVSKVAEVDDNTKNLEELNEVFDKVKEFNDDLRDADTQKKLADAAARIQLAAYERQLIEEREQTKTALAKAKREAYEAGEKQRLEEIEVTPLVLKWDFKK
jgi:hypothetical protein